MATCADASSSLGALPPTPTRRPFSSPRNRRRRRGRRRRSTGSKISRRPFSTGSFRAGSASRTPSRTADGSYSAVRLPAPHGSRRCATGSTPTSNTAFRAYPPPPPQRYWRGEGACAETSRILASPSAGRSGSPARYVCGYLPDIDIPDPHPLEDFHAWFETWLGTRWWTFDARFNVPRIGRVPIGRGRDAVDVAMATTYGPASLEGMTVWADEELTLDEQREPERQSGR